MFRNAILYQDNRLYSHSIPGVMPLSAILCLILTLTACGGAQADTPQEQFQIRKPKATFTPTAATTSGTVETGTQSTEASDNGIVVDDGGGISSVGDVTAATDNTEASTAPIAEDSANQVEPKSLVDPQFSGSQVSINLALVNGRSGPGTEFDVVGVVAINEVFDVLGQNEAGDWWRLCCYLGEEFWVINEYADFRPGPNFNVDSQTTNVAAPVPTATPIPPEPPTPVAISPTDTPAPLTTPESEPAEGSSGVLPFDLVVQEQFAEASVVRIFLYVFSDEVQALEGYSLKVTKNGTELPVGTKSYGPQAGFTWPVATARQRFENMKVEFPGESPDGSWIIELIDGSGNIVGPPATFELTRSEPNQELYVRYKQK